MLMQSGVIRLLPLPDEWDGLAVARGLSEELASQGGGGGEEAMAGGSKRGAAYMQVNRGGRRSQAFERKKS